MKHENKGTTDKIGRLASIEDTRLHLISLRVGEYELRWADEIAARLIPKVVGGTVTRSGVLRQAILEGLRAMEQALSDEPEV